MIQNKLAAVLAYISGILLLLSGITGVDSWMKIQDLTLSLISFPLLQKVFVVVLFLSSLGGIVVILGGFLIYRNKTITGRVLVLIGSGVGIISYALSLFTTVIESGLNVGILFSIAPVAIILAVSSQLVATRKKNYRKRL